MHSSMLRYALPARESSIFRGRWYKQNQMDRSIIWGSFLTAFCIQDKKRSVNYKTNPVLLHKDTWMDGAVPFCFPFPGSAMGEKKARPPNGGRALHFGYRPSPELGSQQLRSTEARSPALQTPSCATSATAVRSVLVRFP